MNYGMNAVGIAETKNINPVLPALRARANDIGEYIDYLEKQLEELSGAVRRLGDREADKKANTELRRMENAQIPAPAPSHLAHALERQATRLQSVNFNLESIIADLNNLI